MKPQICEHCGYALVAVVVCNACRRPVEALTNEVMVMIAASIFVAGYLLGYAISLIK